MRGLSLRWQVAALVAASVAAAQAIAFGVLLLWPPPEPPRMGVAQVLSALAASEADVRAAGLKREVMEEPPSAVGDGRGFTRVIALSLAEALGRPPDEVRVIALDGSDAAPAVLPGAGGATTSVTVRSSSRTGGRTPGVSPALMRVTTPTALLRVLPPAFPPFRAAVLRPDGRWTVVGPRAPLVSPWQARVLLAFGAGALLLAPLAWWSARRLTRPVSLFAEAADRLGLDPGAPPVAVEGPAEVRGAARAFNRMQARLRAHVDGRTAMVAAIAHDLRTPLTGLRLRAETAPPVERRRMAQDIARMEAMIVQVLAFVRGEQVREPREPLDLVALAAECVRAAAELGQPASLAAAEPLWVEGEPVNLRRALGNLLDNAVGYGGGGRVSVRRRNDRALVVVEDDGPGLAEEDLDGVFEPFARGEPSRSRATGGVGLGLASARTIARAHGGDVVLRNRPSGGLDAELILPLTGGGQLE